MSSDDNTHFKQGVGPETEVFCPNVSAYFGPNPTAIDEYNFCPYCGESTATDVHSIDAEISEVFCDETNMSNYRYCPKCGDALQKGTI